MDLGARLGAILRGGEVVALVGELGSGKTVFAKGIALGLGLRDPALVSSPTYVLEQVYPTRIPMHHYDAYRLRSEREFLDLGFEERCREGCVLVVEWADKVPRALPEESLWVELAIPLGGAEPDAPVPAVREIAFSGPARYWEDRLRPVLAGP